MRGGLLENSWDDDSALLPTGTAVNVEYIEIT